MAAVTAIETANAHFSYPSITVWAQHALRDLARLGLPDGAVSYTADVTGDAFTITFVAP